MTPHEDQPSVGHHSVHGPVGRRPGLRPASGRPCTDPFGVAWTGPPMPAEDSHVADSRTANVLPGAPNAAAATDVPRVRGLVSSAVHAE